MDFDKLIETVLERRKQNIDEVLENTKDNAGKQEVVGESACASSGTGDNTQTEIESSSHSSNSASVPDRRNPTGKKLENCSVAQPVSTDDSRNGNPTNVSACT